MALFRFKNWFSLGIGRGVLLLAVSVAPVIANAQDFSYTGTNPAVLLRKYKESRADSNKVQLGLQLGYYYLNKKGLSDQNRDSSLNYARAASVLSKQLQYSAGAEESDVVIGSVYIRTNQEENLAGLLKNCSPVTRIRIMLEMIKYNTYFEIATDEELKTALSYAGESLSLCDSVHSDQLRAMAFLQLANIYYYKDEIAKGREFYLKAVAGVDNLKYLRGEAEIFCQMSTYIKLSRDPLLIPEIQEYGRRLVRSYYSVKDLKEKCTIQNLMVTGYDQLSYFNLYKSRLNQALGFSLEMAKLLEQEGNPYNIEMPYQTISKIYFELGDMAQAISFNKKAYEIVNRKGDVLDVSAVKTVTKAYIGLNQPQEALDFLAELKKKGGYEDQRSKCLINESTGNCYYAMGQYDKAEKYYLQGLSELRRQDNESLFVLCIPLGKVYIQTGQYAKARLYLDKLIGEGTETVPVFVKRDAHYYLFKADSATGNFLSAIHHLQIYKSLNDSIFNQKRNAQLDELMLQYETEKKDKDIKLKEKDISLLTRYAELRDAALQRSVLYRNILIGGIIVLFIVLGLVYNRYLLKQKTNRLLSQQQEQINHNNQVLRSMNEIQKKLIKEKEWLVKEIHHRVKNNLQMIISLLNTQSDFLDNQSAISAIRASKDRMQAIALIHQKLYKPDDNANIDMGAYIRELVDNLQNGFMHTGKISFRLDIDALTLDVSQAVPLGLILNEGITNALKYAFPEGMKGIITIMLKELKEGKVLLRMADNGKGFNKGFDMMTGNSLGIQLIRLFAEQLEGELNFNNREGVEIGLVFHHFSPVSRKSFKEPLVTGNG